MVIQKGLSLQPTEPGTLIQKVTRSYFLRFVRKECQILQMVPVLLTHLPALRCQPLLTWPAYATHSISADQMWCSSGKLCRCPKSAILPHMTTIIKQHGALLIKDLGIQFDELFKDSLSDDYEDAISYAKQIRLACKMLVSLILKIQPMMPEHENQLKGDFLGKI